MLTCKADLRNRACAAREARARVPYLCGFGTADNVANLDGLCIAVDGRYFRVDAQIQLEPAPQRLGFCYQQAVPIGNDPSDVVLRVKRTSVKGGK